MTHHLYVIQHTQITSADRRHLVLFSLRTTGFSARLVIWTNLCFFFCLSIFSVDFVHVFSLLGSQVNLEETIVYQGILCLCQAHEMILQLCSQCFSLSYHPVLQLCLVLSRVYTVNESDMVCIC